MHFICVSPLRVKLKTQVTILASYVHMYAKVLHALLVNVNVGVGSLAQLQHVVWSVEEILRRRAKDGHFPTGRGIRAAGEYSVMLPYDSVMDELLNKASGAREKTIGPHEGTTRGKGGAGAWDTKRMKALAQTVPKLAPAETSMEMLLSIAASLWSSYLVIADLEAGRTVEAVIEETAGHRINTMKRHYGQALHVLSDTAKELVSDGHLCGHLFVLLEGFAAHSIEDYKPWYDVEYFEGELLRHMQRELLASVRPLEEAFSVAAAYKAEQSAKRRQAKVGDKGDKASNLLDGETGESPADDPSKIDSGLVVTFNNKNRARSHLQQEQEATEGERRSGNRARHPSDCQSTLESRASAHNIERSNSTYTEKERLAGDPPHDTAAMKESSQRITQSTISTEEIDGEHSFKHFFLPEVSLAGYHVTTAQGHFHAGFVGESNTYALNKELHKAYTKEGVLLEIQLCQKHDRFLPSLLEDEPDIAAEELEELLTGSNDYLTRGHTNSSVGGDCLANESAGDARQKDSANISSNALHTEAPRRLDSVVSPPWYVDFQTRSGHKVSSSPTLRDPPGARVSVEQLRHLGAAAAATSGVSAAVADAVAAADARRKAPAVATANRDNDTDEQNGDYEKDGDTDTHIVNSNAASASEIDASCVSRKHSVTRRSPLRGDWASRHSSYSPPTNHNDDSADGPPSAVEALGKGARAAGVIAKAAALEGKYPGVRKENQEPVLPLLLTMQAFSRHLGDGKPLWIFNRCRVVHSTIDDRRGSSSIFHHLMLAPDTDADIHFFVNIPRQNYSKQAAENLRQAFLLLGRTAHSSDKDNQVANLLHVHVRDSRLQLLGTAQREEDGRLLKLQYFGLALDENQIHNVNQGLSTLLPYLPAGQAWRHIRADRLFARIISSCRLFLDIPYAVKVPFRAMKRRTRPTKQPEGGTVPTWLCATAVVCTALPLLLFMCCLHFSGRMPMPWWLSCVFSSRSPWGSDYRRRTREEESRTLPRNTTQSVTGTSARTRRYGSAAPPHVNGLRQQRQHQQPPEHHRPARLPADKGNSNGRSSKNPTTANPTLCGGTLCCMVFP